MRCPADQARGIRREPRQRETARPREVAGGVSPGLTAAPCRDCPPRPWVPLDAAAGGPLGCPASAPMPGSSRTTRARPTAA
eukprot:1989134-Alexandrium_andersonii.AAC.1